jgi:hypothetical protein
LLALAGSLVLVGFGVRVSDLGGKLVYQHGAAAAYVEGGRSGAGRGDSVEP